MKPWPYTSRVFGVPLIEMPMWERIPSHYEHPTRRCTMLSWLSAKLNTRARRGLYLGNKLWIPLHAGVLADWLLAPLVDGPVAIVAYVVTAAALWLGGKIPRARQIRQLPAHERPATWRRFAGDCVADAWIAWGAFPLFFQLGAWSAGALVAWCVGVYVIYRLRLTDEIESYGILDHAIAAAREWRRYFGYADVRGYSGLLDRYADRMAVGLLEYSGERDAMPFVSDPRNAA